MLGLPARRLLPGVHVLHVCHALALLLFTLLTIVPRAAHADPRSAGGVGVAVLSFDSDDAEDQAEAITTALRSRVTNGGGIWLLETNSQTLGTLTTAFKCPSRPTYECQQKIADQIHADRYLYGFVTKGPQAGQVTAEVHFFQRGKAEQPAIKESFSDNLKDGNDDTLRKIAARIMDRLSNTVIGVVIVKSSEQTGDVIIDGEKHVPLAHGTARIELAPGTHSIELATASGQSTKRPIMVTVGRDTVLEMSGAPATSGPGPDQKSNTRKVIGGSVAGVGVVLGVVAVIELAHYFSLQSDGDAQAATLPKNGQDGAKECREYNQKCMDIDHDSKVASGLAIGLGAAAAASIGVGAYLFFTDPAEKTSSSAKTRIVPSVGPGSGGLTVLGTF